MRILGHTVSAKTVAGPAEHTTDRIAGDLRAAEKTFLRDNGFLAMPDFSTQSDLRELRDLINGLLADQTLSDKTIVRDLSGQETLAIREIVSPSQLEPKLLQTRIYRRALTVTEAMFGPGATLAFDHIIDKPAHNMKETAWHQDSTYSSPLSLSARRLHWWIPLQDVHENNGCMAYVPGSHLGPRLKHVPVAPGAHTRKTDVPAERAQYCPIPAGGACMHLPRTLHYTGPNRSDRPRVAWIFQIVLRSAMPMWV